VDGLAPGKYVGDDPFVGLRFSDLNQLFVRSLCHEAIKVCSTAHEQYVIVLHQRATQLVAERANPTLLLWTLWLKPPGDKDMHA
jgi:hypothetical protein